MRTSIRQQLPIVQPQIDHEHARELQAMSEVLDKMPQAIEIVHADLVRGLSDPDKGREGMTAEQVLRALVIKQLNGFSYEELAFHLADSCSYNAFCRLGLADDPPSKSALQRDLLRPQARHHRRRLRAVDRPGHQAGKSSRLHPRDRKSVV